MNTNVDVNTNTNTNENLNAYAYVYTIVNCNCKEIQTSYNGFPKMDVHQWQFNNGSIFMDIQ